MNPVPEARERLVFALDVPTIAEAEALVAHLGNVVVFYKLGLELFTAGDAAGLVYRLKAAGKRVFVDLKLFDVPATVARAVARLAALEVDFLTVHGNQAMMEAAAGAKGASRVLAVTALTSLDEGDLADLGFRCELEALVASRARRALEAGLDGVVASGREAKMLRSQLGPRLLVVTPGIRPLANREEDDQKRVMSPAAAIRAGADYLVVGRPIRDADDPRAAAERIVGEIAAALAP
ncbi:MAG TPA: orotidine-5'-phosphate decarboxylase [Gammaproteobacteria bacterium]|nr:orotidine-5'-phosphate decarboxylase [Gammaproteobacteria bacterium]